MVHGSYNSILAFGYTACTVLLDQDGEGLTGSALVFVIIQEQSDFIGAVKYWYTERKYILL